MDAFLSKLMTDYGILGLFLAGVVAYFLRAEVVFWRERESYKTALQAAHDNFITIMKERVSEQQAVVKELTTAMEKVETRVHDAEMEFIKMQDLIIAKLEQMQMQRMMPTGGQSATKL